MKLPNPIFLQIQSRLVVWTLRVFVAASACLALHCSNGGTWDLLNTLALLTCLVTGMIAAIGFLCWSFTAHKYIPTFIPRESGSIWQSAFLHSWFIPVLNLFAPFEHMRDLWRAGDMNANNLEDWRKLRVPTEFYLWWTCWLIPGFLIYFGSSLSDSGLNVWLIFLGANIISGILCSRIVAATTARYVHKLHAMEAQARVVSAIELSPEPPAKETSGVTIDISQRSEVPQ